MNTQVKKQRILSFVFYKHIINESRFQTFYSYFKVVLSAVKSIAYSLAVIVMYTQYKYGTDDRILAKALLGFLLVLAIIEIFYALTSVFEEDYQRTIKMLVYLILLIMCSFIGRNWFLSILNSY